MTPERTKRLTLVACILGSFVALLDGTIVNVALPAIEDDLGGGLATQQWVVNGYMLMLGSLILVGGSLGDVFGERTIFGIGVGAFGVTSLLCGLAPTDETLIAARALQGISGALLTPAALAVIIATFPAEERGAAIGSWTAWGSIAAVLGPLAGGQILDVASWRWIFLINVPFVAVCLFLVLTVIPRRADRTERRHVDLPGATLAALGLAGPVFGLIQQPVYGWSDPLVVVPIAAGLVLLAVFLAYERRARDPMLPLGLFRRRNFAVGNLETLAMYGGLSILFFLLALFLQQTAGYSALEAGAATLPTTVLMFFLSAQFGRLADRFGPRLFMGVGPLFMSAGFLLFLRLDETVSYVSDLLPAIVVFSIGLSMTVAPLTATVLAGAESSQAGIASAVNNAIARIAGLLTVSAIGAVIGGNVDVDGFRIGMGLGAALVATGGIVGAVGIVNPGRAVRAEDCPGGQIAGSPRDAAACGAGQRLPGELERVPAGVGP